MLGKQREEQAFFLFSFLFSFVREKKGDNDEFCFGNTEFKVIRSDQQDM